MATSDSREICGNIKWSYNKGSPLHNTIRKHKVKILVKFDPLKATKPKRPLAQTSGYIGVYNFVSLREQMKCYMEGKMFRKAKLSHERTSRNLDELIAHHIQIYGRVIPTFYNTGQILVLNIFFFTNQPNPLPHLNKWWN